MSHEVEKEVDRDEAFIVSCTCGMQFCHLGPEAATKAQEKYRQHLERKVA